MINIAVLKKVMGTTGQPVHARVDAKVTNLHGQVSPITMRELNEQGAVYYIGEFAIANEESLRFEIEVTPEGQAESIRAAFDQVFFVD